MSLPPVQIAFDCLPLRSISRLDIPLDASEEYRARLERIKSAFQTYGTQRAYYLLEASCAFHLVNSDVTGMLRYAFEGTLLTDSSDQVTERVVLDVELVGHTVDWLTEPVEQWFAETVRRAVAIEFDRYISTGGLAARNAQIERVREGSEPATGFLGMYL